MMASYLLLRNNTQSGPYELSDLLNVGLKPYDLVWVHGKSAAWRYPSEVEELKPYAPTVEEQPYDRFYKKNTPETKEAPDSYRVKEEKAVPVEAIASPQPVAQAIEEKYEKYIPKKSVFVTMPGQAATATVQRPVAAEPVPEPAPVITITENPAAAQIKYSQPLDEIKEMYVRTLQERKSKIARKSFLLANLKKAAVIAGLVAIGILTGLVIKSNSGHPDSLVKEVLQQPVQTSAGIAKDPLINPPLEDNKQLAGTDQPAAEPLTPQVKEDMLRREDKQLTEPVKVDRKPVVTSPLETQDDKQTYKPVETNPVTGERSKAVRNETNDDRPVAKNTMPARKSGLENLVSVTSNEYKRVAFGGIRNLELTITNDSKFVLDKVTVELQYLKPSEEPLKTEMLQFRSVSPNGTMTMKVKDTNRGIKVLYKIVDIQAQGQETAVSGF